ncbi:MAG: DUF748 domain-containing protein [Acidovorax sp.]
MSIQSLKNNKWARRAAWFVLAVLVLWAIGWLAVPPLLRSQGQKLASEALGRQVTIGKVEFSPWSLELTVHDLAVAKADGKGDQLAVKRIYVDAEAQSLFRLAPVLDAVQVDAPVVHLAQTSPGHYDIDDILARFASKPQEPAAKDSAPPHFAIYNIALNGGAVDFDDRTVGRVQELRDLTLAVPFVSNLESKREIKVEPRLAFKLNGSTFDSHAESTPFLASRKTDANIRLAGFDLGPYLGYLPDSLPVRVQSGVLDVDLQLSFEQTPATAVHLRGSVQAKDVRVADAQKQPLLGFDALKVQIADLQPLAQRGHITAVEIDAPKVRATRDGKGRINWTSLSAAPSEKPAEKPASKEEGGWQMAVDRVAVHGAQVDWQDDAVAGGAQLALTGLDAEAHAIAVPFAKPLQFSGRAQLGAGKTGPARIDFEGQATDRLGKVAASVRSLPLALGAPYLAEQLTPSLAGQLDTDLGLAWNGPAVVAQIARLSLADVALSCPAKATCAGAGLPGVAMRGKDSLAELKALQVDNARIDLLRRVVEVERLTLTQPRALAVRDKEGHWMAEQWMRATSTPKVAPQPAQNAKAQAAKTAEPPWAVHLGALDIDGGAAALHDAQPAKPVALALSGVKLRLEDFAPLAAKTAKPSRLTVAARLGAVSNRAAEPGKLEYDGTLSLAPLAAEGKVLATQLPLHVFEPYAADALNVRILRADGSFKGSVKFAADAKGPAVRVLGDAALDDLRVRSALLTTPKAGQDSPAPRGLARQDDLLNWKSLGLRGVNVALAPGKPLQVDVRETSLNDFFARVIVQDTGRINLQDLVKHPANAAAAEAPAAGASAPAAAASAPAVAQAQAQATAADPNAPVIRFGPVSLTGGTVRFSDYFIKPNYTADLSELNGRLSAFSSVPPTGGAAPELADLELRGRAEGTASLEVTGKLNPLAKPLALDIVGKVRDLELPPLSPYTVKYAGHGIERGKLSMDVAYKVEPNGQLTAKNKLVLNQLTFGDPVEGAPASLPVRLAVALLADRNGVIDLDLPISGSLNDPQFSIGPVIFKIIGNIIMKAVTAPFSLLAGAFGGGSADDQGDIVFAPGSAVLDDAARARLDKIAKSLADRAALQLTVTGEAQLESEREGWKKARLQALMLAQKRSAAMRSGQAAADVAPVTPEEAPALLKEVYRRADIPKPRNLVGMAKDLPQAEMESLLLASIPVPDDAMRELAVARGVAVRDYLAAHKVPLDRLFLGAVKTNSTDKDWKPRAQLSLATQ